MAFARKAVYNGVLKEGIVGTILHDGKRFRISERLIPILLGLAGLASAQTYCDGLTDAHTVQKEVGPGDNLMNAVSNAAAGTTLLLKPGTYKITGTLQFAKNGVTLRSSTGKRTDVVIDGNKGSETSLQRSNFVPELIAVSASGVTLADFSIRHARDHAIHAYPPSTKNIDSLLIHNLLVQDCGQQLIKVNSNGEQPLSWVDKGTIQCSEIGFTDNSVMQVSGDGFYTGGIDIHGGRDWTVRGNTFRNIENNGKLMEHAIHFWHRARGTRIESNRIENCYRGIGLGMLTESDGMTRDYADDADNAPFVDHVGGMIVNNVIWNQKGIHLESGIELMNVGGAEIYHNTVFSLDAPFSGIEYRWPNTQVTLKNNLVGAGLMARDGGKATKAGNLESAPQSLFENAATGDLRLKATATSAIDKGVSLDAGLVPMDMLSAGRDVKPDIGAYEFGAVSSLHRPQYRRQGHVFPGSSGRLPAYLHPYDVRPYLGPYPLARLDGRFWGKRSAF